MGLLIEDKNQRNTEQTFHKMSSYWGNGSPVSREEGRHTADLEPPCFCPWLALHCLLQALRNSGSIFYFRSDFTFITIILPAALPAAQGIMKVLLMFIDMEATFNRGRVTCWGHDANVLTLESRSSDNLSHVLLSFHRDHWTRDTWKLADGTNDPW